MSNKSGISSQVISLPQGGGAQHGIGEKFSPDLYTGTGNFTVPIALPPGRNGFQPQLNLVYSTGNGNGCFGIGWNLSIPGISRQTAKGIPRYDDAKDIFVLSGAEDLVPVEQQLGVTRYQPRTEGLFAKILHYQDALNNYWEVRSKDGLISLYGTPAVAGNDPAAIANPADRSNVFAWKLTRTTDPFGNRIDYLYERDDVHSDDPHQWDQLYLSEIRYVDYGDRANPRFLVRVKFTYETRPDPFSEYRAGFEMRTVRRCNRIEVFTQPDREILTRTYQLIYLDQRGLPPEQLPINRVSLLNQVQVKGHDGTETEWLSPLEFSYTRFEPERRDFFPIVGPDLPPGSLARPEYELADLLGNGLPDILEMNGTVRYWRNLGNGRFDRPREMKDAPAGLQLADPGIQMIDAQGDGRIDLLVTTLGLSGYFPLQFGGLWDRKSFQRYAVAPSFNLEDPEVKLVDLTGDAVTDAIRSGSRMECFFNDPKLGWKETRWVERQAIDKFPNINFSDPRVKWGDMSGDGLQDIVLVHDGNIEYWPNLGYGNWGKRLSMHNSPRFRYGYDPRRILIGDIDGDGLADIVYVDNNKVILWINQSGNGWSDPIEIKGTPPVSDMDAVRLVDMLGTGVAGVLWSADVGGLSRQNMFFLDFTGGVKPYLLSEMNNHMGSLTRVGYQSSIQFYLTDENQPESRWKTALPFPVQVVARVEVIDFISQGKLTTEYQYHHGYWDGAEREFRGFGRVEQRDSEIFENFNREGLHGDRAFEQIGAQFSPPLETRTWFHQGSAGDEFGDWYELDFSNEFWAGDPQMLSRPQSMEDLLKGLPRRAKRDALRTLRGSILRTELYALDGTAEQNRPYTVTESLHGIREESPTELKEEQRSRIFFPMALAERTTQWERGNEPMTQFKFMGDYDAYGQVLSQIGIAVPRGRDFQIPVTTADPYLCTYTETTYAQRDDDQKYMVDRVARTTSYEILNDGSLTLWQLWEMVRAGLASQQIIGQTLNFYDGSEFQGLPFGQLGDYGALVRTESLVMTEAILQEAYRSGNNALIPTELPPYLVTDGVIVWTSDYPQEFRDRLDQLPDLAGYLYQVGGAGSEYATGFFAIAERRSYDFHDPGGEGRGLVRIIRDPLGRETMISYDTPYHLLPVEVTDPMDLTTRADYDYRVLEPREVTDPNGNRTTYSFTPLGLLTSTAVMGKIGEAVGDTPTEPSVQMVYDFLAFTERSQPISVRAIRREHHVHETDVSPSEQNLTLETVEYSDGFGRLLQTRTQAEEVTFGDRTFGGGTLPSDQTDEAGTRQDVVGQTNTDPNNPNVVVSGWQIYDNKGRVVEKYEPFFSMGWSFIAPTDSQKGQKVAMFYDPRGQVIRTLNPDGSEQRVIYGIPEDLSQPDRFVPTPWEAYTYDANDNAERTHNRGNPNHWNTPASIEIDALGRTIRAVERNGSDRSTDGYTTHSTYDIRGNLLTVTDALGRIAFRYTYNLANQPLRIDSIDAGIRRTILDGMGNAIEQRDSKGALVLNAYDSLNRPQLLWARDGLNSAITLRQRLSYGDELADRLQTAQANLLGKSYQHYDEAGLTTFTIYDFKGNNLEKSRQAIADAAILSVFNAPTVNGIIPAFQVDWTTGNAPALDSAVYQTTARYDALNRLKILQYPQDVEGERKVLRPRYNRAGALEQVELDGDRYVDRIAYNAKGQRSLIAYGNGIMTRYDYDRHTFRLVRLRTERYEQPDLLTYRPRGAALQDFAYEYDLVGNILTIRDRSPESGIPNSFLGTDALDRSFTYDPLYRLLSATGRECDLPPTTYTGNNLPSAGGGQRCTNLTRTRPYQEQYQYDPAGNMLRLRHEHFQADGSLMGRNRDFTVAANNNRLESVTVGQQVDDYAYDDNGNLIRENQSRYFEWDYGDRLRVFRIQAGSSAPSVYAVYLYDASGQRVKKLVRNGNNQIEVTVYIDGIFEYHRLVQGSSTYENNTLHVMDNQQRIALVRVGEAFPGDGAPTVRVKYQLGDHLGSSNLVIDESGSWMNREEFTPYGETSFGSFARKRYRFTGKERDEESGLNYHGARYYASWLARWINPDPLGAIDKLNLYRYAKSSPINYVDKNGFNSESQIDVSSITSEKDHLQSIMERELRKNNIAYIKEAQITVIDKFGNETPGISDFLTKQQGEIIDTEAKLDWDSPMTKGQKVRHPLQQAGAEVRIDDSRASNLGLERGTKVKAKPEIVNKHTVSDWAKSLSNEIKTKTTEFILRRNNQVIKRGVTTAKEIINNPKLIKAATHLKSVAKHISNPVLGSLGAAVTALSIAGTAEAATTSITSTAQGDYATATSSGASATADIVEMTPTPAGALVGASRAGWAVGETINVFLSDDVKNAIGGTINEIVNEGGWKELFKHPFGIGM